ncbi:PBP1A family penicillin-binding protein [Sphingorhabdus sp. Alg239-R122]|uniref:transglycosylase domain-containing protein n=1 Tax=Sphingorhabdus sp. Alg239-R122 TaxID=2305989 RepID=UPI0013DD61BA|nr:PBP1A family penicillin-binding protein [Sphingorhabdus sp. Alg239-R122]
MARVKKPVKKKARTRSASAPKQSRFKTWFWRLFKTGLVLGFIAIIGLVSAVGFTMSSLPSYEALRKSPNGQMILVRANDGTEIMSLGPSFGEWLEIEEIPGVMKDAMIAVEDRRFESHFGVDPYGMGRASWFAVKNYGTGRRMQGASTITQQLARNIFLSNSYTFWRKAREMVLALAMERKFTKDQILELYLNKVYFGGGAYGIDSASRKFFSHPATELDLAEASIIAGLVKAPSRYSPTADAQAAIDRASVVLKVMRDTGKITAAQAASVNPSAVKLAPDKAQNSVRYFTDWALPQLDMLLPETDAPIEVWTTLDLRMQRAATAAIQANVPGGAQGAIVSLDRDGAVLAMVGGTDYVTSNYNRATNAVRQPGSAWKLFVYLAALEAGYTPEDIVTDEKVTIDGWTPRNSGGRFAGDITLRTAFAYSKNTVAAQLGNELGYGTIASMARRFGVTTPINTHPSMVLGTSETRVIDMTRAFAGVNARGAAIMPYGVTKVTTIKGEILYEAKPDLTQVLIPPHVAAGITDLLQTAVNTGTGRAAQIGRPVAGKTGTTNSNKDGWFLGFSSGITTGVWMGRDDARQVKSLQGGRAPAKAFADYMRVAVSGRKVEKFDTELVLPEWQLEPDDEAYFENPDDMIFVDEYGNPIDVDGGESLPPGPDLPPVEGQRAPGESGPGVLDQDFIDRATGKTEAQGKEQPEPKEVPAQRDPAPPPPRNEPALEEGIY